MPPFNVFLITGKNFISCENSVALYIRYALPHSPLQGDAGGEIPVTIILVCVVSGLLISFYFIKLKLLKFSGKTGFRNIIFIVVLRKS